MTDHAHSSKRFVGGAAVRPLHWAGRRSLNISFDDDVACVDGDWDEACEDEDDDWGPEDLDDLVRSNVD